MAMPTQEADHFCSLQMKIFFNPMRWHHGSFWSLIASPQEKSLIISERSGLDIQCCPRCPFIVCSQFQAYKDYLEPTTWTWLQVCCSENLTLPRWPGTVATLKGF